MKYFVKKAIHLTTALTFFLQQTVSFFPAFAMDPDDLSPIESSKSKSKKPRKSRSKKTPLPAFSLNYLKTLKQEDLEKDLEQRRFKTIAEEDQRSLFELIKGYKFRNLVLRDAGFLQNRFFFKEAQLEYLLILNLEGAISLTDKIVPLIAEKAPSLESLTLARIPNMKGIGKRRKGFFDASPLYILFPSLRYLNISYGEFNTVLIEAPKLEVFKARAAKVLQVLDVNQQNKASQHKAGTASSALRKVDLREVQSLPLKTFVQLLQNHPELKLQAEALQQLPPIPYKDFKLPLEEENLKRFIEQYRRATEANDSEAQYTLGEMYANGQNVLQNAENAMEWYQKAAQQNHMNAQFQLGEMHAHGQGVKQNFDTACEWYQKAAHNGHPAGVKVFELIEGQENQEEVRISSQNLTPVDIRFVFAFLRNMPLKKLSLRAYIDIDGEELISFIGAEGARFISEGLKYTPGLQQLSLGLNVEAEGAHLISEGLKHVPGLQRLSLGLNYVEVEEARFISEGLKHVPGLQQLSLGLNVEAEGARFISEGLRYVTSLQQLDLSSDRIGVEGIRFISDGLKYVPDLQQLYLSSGRIGVGGIRFISEGLRYVTSLQQLYLGGNNKIGDEETRFISEGLKHVSGLQQLSLGGPNKMGDEGARFISEGLQYVTSLQQLNLSGNRIGDEGIRFISEGLRYVTSLQQLNLSGNRIGVEGIRFIDELKKKYPQLLIK